MPDEIFHYCSPNVFLSLIQKKELWLTALTQSNDVMEGEWMLQEWLRRFDLGKGKSERDRQTGARWAVRIALNQKAALGTCFSEKGDLLSQWRGYAQDGSGFAVGFNREKLDRQLCARKDLLPAALSKIAYGHHNQEEVNEVVKLLSAAFMSDAERFVSDPDGNGRGDYLMTFRSSEKAEAAKRLFTVKNPAFQEEKEWRILLVDYVSRIPGVEFRESRGVLSPFVRMKVESDVISSVTLGPTNKTPENVVVQALRAYGVECRVTKSSASYRNA